MDDVVLVQVLQASRNLARRLQESCSEHRLKITGCLTRCPDGKLTISWASLSSPAAKQADHIQKHIQL
jgi:hypothetical protein